MKRKIIKFLTVLFITISIIFTAIGLYVIFVIIKLPKVDDLSRTLVILMIVLSICYSALSFIIMSLILRQSYKIMDERK